MRAIAAAVLTFACLATACGSASPGASPTLSSPSSIPSGGTKLSFTGNPIGDVSVPSTCSLGSGSFDIQSTFVLASVSYVLSFHLEAYSSSRSTYQVVPVASGLSMQAQPDAVVSLGPTDQQAQASIPLLVGLNGVISVHTDGRSGLVDADLGSSRLIPPPSPTGHVTGSWSC